VPQANLYKFTDKPLTDNLENFEVVFDFVNMVWRNSSSMGCDSIAANDNKCVAVVCLYSPKSVQSNSAFFANVRKPGQASGGGPRAEDDSGALLLGVTSSCMAQG
jgi:hypothetical protein